MQLRYIDVSPSVLEGLFKGAKPFESEGFYYEVINPIPEDAKLVSVQPLGERNLYRFHFQSASFAVQPYSSALDPEPSYRMIAMPTIRGDDNADA